MTQEQLNKANAAGRRDARNHYAYPLVMVFISLIILVSVNMFYTSYQISKMGHQFCDLVTSSDDAYTSTPPTSPTGKKIALEMHQLRSRLQCK